MRINLTTCKFVVWGFKNTYNTFQHIHEAFYRALKFKFPDRQVLWLDDQDRIDGVDFSNTFFISMNYAVSGMPKREDCFYAVHNIESRAKEYLAGLSLLNYGVYVNGVEDLSSWIQSGPDTFFHRQEWEAYSTVVFRWGTDLLPHEIEANKPNRVSHVFRYDSREAYFVGTAIEPLRPFERACAENGISFRVAHHISVEENIRLIQKSYMAPAINIPWQSEVGYIPCRIFKNISYGQMGITNNKAVYDFFKGRVIYNANPYDLFYEARHQLPFVSLETLHGLMDEIAEKHTYLNKIDALLNAAKLTEEMRAN